MKQRLLSLGLPVTLTSSIVLIAYPADPFGWAVILISLLSLTAVVFALFRISRTMKNADRKNSDQVRSEAIGGIMQVAATRDSLIELLNYSLDRILELFSLNSGAIHIYHSAKNMLVMGAYRGLSPMHASRLEMVNPGQSAIGRALQNKRVLIIRDLKISPDFAFFGGKTEGYSFLAVSPILVENECWGVITLLGRKSYYRGILEVSLLEQCGIQLGQALKIGRQNRRITANYERQKMIIDHICQCLLGIDSRDIGRWLDRTINGFPGGLFGGVRFVVISGSDGSWRVLYQHPEIQTGPIQYHFDMALALSGKVPKSDRQVQIREIAKKELSTNPAAAYFEKPDLTALHYFLEGVSVIALVDLPRDMIERSFAQDVLILQTLLKLSFAFDNRESASFPGGGPLRESSDIINNAGSILTDIKGKIDLLKAECEEKSSEMVPERLVAKLKSISDDISLRSTLLVRHEPVDLNLILNDLLRNSDLNYDFKPSVRPIYSHIPEREFIDLMRDILTRAFEGNRKVSLSIGADNGRAAITIAGDVRRDYNANSVVEWSGKYDLILNIVDRNPSLHKEADTFSSTGKSSGRRALIIESRDIIKGLLADYLGKLGFETDFALTAAQALDMIANNAEKGAHYDLAITDMTLTDMSGAALVGSIKEKYPGIYAVLMASWGGTIAEDSLKQYGIDAVIYKPFSLEQLRQAVLAGSSRIE